MNAGATNKTWKSSAFHGWQSPVFCPLNILVMVFLRSPLSGCWRRKTRSKFLPNKKREKNKNP